MGHRAQERADRPKEPEGSHPPPQHRLYPDAARSERYKEPTLDQLALGFVPPAGLGHNQPPEPIDPPPGLSERLATSHADLVARFRDLELGCVRVPDPLASDEDAATLTDFIAQCQAHIRQAEAAHKAEKALFLKAGRVVDGFFKRRCNGLPAALAPAVARRK